MALKIALLGTGLMGFPMSINLLNAGFPLNAWNRTRSKADALTTHGAVVFDDPPSAVDDADVIITMLENGPVVEEVLFNETVLSHLKPNSTVIDMSSIPPHMAQDHAKRLNAIDIQYLDAPVSGGTMGAAQATLAIMAGGSRETFDNMMPIFKTLGRPTYIGLAGTGQIAKCANQSIVANTIAAVSEGLLLAAAGGADPAAVREALSGGFADSRILQEHGKRLLERNFIPGGAVKTQLKDLNTALAVVEGLHLPVTAKTQEIYQTLVNNGASDYDHSAYLLELENINPGKKLTQAETKLPK